MTKRKNMAKAIAALTGLIAFHLAIFAVALGLTVLATHFIYGVSVPVQRDYVLLAVSALAIVLIIAFRATEPVIAALWKVAVYCALYSAVLLGIRVLGSRLRHGGFIMTDGVVLLCCVVLYLVCHLYLVRTGAIPKFRKRSAR